MLIAFLLSATSVSAHVPPVAGKLVDCTQRSDVIVVVLIDRVTDLDARSVDITARVERRIVGEAPEPTVTFRGNVRLISQQRYVVFLRREGTAVIGVEPAGVFFPSAPADDALYAQVITGVRSALAEKGDVRVDRLRSALIPALRAAPRELRINAVLELGALAHHGTLSAEHRSQLEAIVAEPGIDPTLRRMIGIVASGQSAVGSEER